MTHHDDLYGYNGGHHVFENDSRGGHASWELGMLLSLFMLPVVIGQFLTAFLTPIGMLLAASGLLSPEKYGPVFSKPTPILLVGILVWVGLRFVRIGATHLLGGGQMRRTELFKTK